MIDCDQNSFFAFKTVIAIVVFGCSPELVCADIMPAGHKGVSHKLVFQSSEALSEYRLVAAPTAGFGGQVEVVPNEPFDFSSKYGTRIYWIPKSVDEIPRFNRELFAQWPCALPPRSEIRSVPMWSPVKSALSTIRLASIEGDQLNLVLVDHVEYDSSGNIVTEFQKRFWSTATLAVPIASVIAGVLVCVFVYFSVRKSDPAETNE